MLVFKHASVLTRVRNKYVNVVCIYVVMCVSAYFTWPISRRKDDVKRKR